MLAAASTSTLSVRWKQLLVKVIKAGKAPLADKLPMKEYLLAAVAVPGKATGKNGETATNGQ